MPEHWRNMLSPSSELKLKLGGNIGLTFIFEKQAKRIQTNRQPSMSLQTGVGFDTE
jgi:hypothetical protein